MGTGILNKIDDFNRRFASIIKPIILFPKRVYNIKNIINKPTFYPDKVRKSKSKMWMDNFIWLLKNGELNEYYISYGLDIVDFRDEKDFLPKQEFIYLRDKGNDFRVITTSSIDYNYLSVIRDKYIFSEYLNSTLGEKNIVQNLGIISNGEYFSKETKKWDDLNQLFILKNQIVIKTLEGECADGVYLLENVDNKFLLNGKDTDVEGLKKTFSKGNFVVQDVVIQHDFLKSFKTKSVNTIRLITIRNKKNEVNIFSAFLRIGNTSESFVDNRALGGLAVGIDLEKGTLMKYGIPHVGLGSLVEYHNLSGIKFEGLQLPYWNEIKEIAIEAHKQFYTFQSIGWDIIITNDGPIILEGNDSWEIGGPQDTLGGLKEKWRKLTS